MDNYLPKPEHKFTFGLWTVGSLGSDPFGSACVHRKHPLSWSTYWARWGLTASISMTMT